jgi:mannonate dehydratase
MANHPYDPPGLPWGYEGVDNFDSPSIFDAYERYAMIVDDPHNGFQMDVGVLAEVYPDEGVLDLFPIMRILRDSGYLGGILPDHVPASEGDPVKLRGHAFAYGYIKGLIASINSEA